MLYQVRPTVLFRGREIIPSPPLPNPQISTSSFPGLEIILPPVALVQRSLPSHITCPKTAQRSPPGQEIIPPLSFPRPAASSSQQTKLNIDGSVQLKNRQPRIQGCLARCFFDGGDVGEERAFRFFDGFKTAGPVGFSLL